MEQIWNRTTTSFLGFLRLEHAQATHEHTEQLTTRLGSVSFVDAITPFILLHEKFLQFDWLRAVLCQLNLKYLHVKITNLLWVVV